MALKGTDNEKLNELCGSKTYKEQAIWFLNSFWDTLEGEAEVLWNYVDKCNVLDLEKHAEGSGLDEMNAHVFLEAFNETQTVREMRTSLRSTGAIGEKERPKSVPLTHWLLFKYQVDWHHLVNASQGDNKAEIEKAQRLLQEVQAAFEAANARAGESAAAAIAAQNAANSAKRAAEEAKVSEADSYAKAEESKQREVESRAAKAELEAALAEVKAQEDAYNNKTEDLKKKSEEGGVVSRNRAKNELAQHLGEDPLPLRRAKITAEAAVKKADKAAKAAAEAVTRAEEAAAQASKDREAAEESHRAAEESAKAAEEAKQAAEAALEEARAALVEAETFLEEVKQQPGQAMGAIWWIDRELHEAKKYLPESKGGIRR